MKLPRETFLFHLERRDEVQPQQGKVRQVVPGKGFLVEVAVDKAQAFEAGGGGPEPVKAGDLDLPVVADHYVAYLPFPVDQYPYLPVDFPGELGDVSRQLMGYDSIGG